MVATPRTGHNFGVRWVALPTVLLALFQLGRAGWVDPDTPEEYRTTVPLTPGDNRHFEMVFSDEFDQDGRTFYDGYDPRWTALDKNDYTNKALQFYNPENAVTTNGVLNITTNLKVNEFRAYKKDGQLYLGKKTIQSSMLQGWNKFCITGGIVEFSAKLPGKPHVGGLWPALWLLGNLARATFVSSSAFMWPFSFNHCDETAFETQEINKCLKATNFGMKPGVGRGAPEIDVLEAMQGNEDPLPNTFIRRPYVSTSLQLAPGKSGTRPTTGQLPEKGKWYEGLEYGKELNTSLNNFFYGSYLFQTPESRSYQTDAVSANTHVTKTFYNSLHLYRVEWEPPAMDGSGGYIRWYIDNEFAFGVKGENLNLTRTQIPSEPMYLLMNTAVSSNWGFPGCPSGCSCKCYECGKPECMCGLPHGFCSNLPAHLEVDYVRVYQAVNSSRQLLGCSTPHRPTKRFIEAHKDRYKSSSQSEPLKAIQRGGAGCSVSTDCGGPLKGACKYGHCSCMKGYTGPACLAPDGYYDNVPPPRELPVSSMMIPTTLLIVVIVLVVAFLVSWRRIVLRKREGRQYTTVDEAYNGSSSQVAAPGFSTYQQPALSTDQKVVTYLVVDGRLIDKK